MFFLDHILVRTSLLRCLCKIDACPPPLCLLLPSHQTYLWCLPSIFVLAFLGFFSRLPFLALLSSLNHLYGTYGRTVLREMWGRQERTGRRRQETEEGGKDYQMRRWKSCGQHLTPDKGKKRKRERYATLFNVILKGLPFKQTWAANVQPWRLFIPLSLKGHSSDT